MTEKVPRETRKMDPAPVSEADLADLHEGELHYVHFVLEKVEFE